MRYLLLSLFCIAAYINPVTIAASQELSHSQNANFSGDMGIEQTLIQADEAHYDGAFISLKGHVYVVSPLGEVDAEEATVDTVRVEGEWVASHVILTGHVKMKNANKTQFALADRIEIFPQEKVMLFESLKEGEHVLFLDIENHMQLAAHKVRAEKGEKEIIQGYGDVRCVFGVEELERFKSHFAWES